MEDSTYVVHAENMHIQAKESLEKVNANEASD